VRTQPTISSGPRRTLAGYEAMAMIRKGQLRNIGGRDMRAQASFIAEMFEIAA
jgi:transposase, IS6 family